jgi:predicted alpha/beta-hydrolase family hydrolase
LSQLLQPDHILRRLPSYLWASRNDQPMLALTPPSPRFGYVLAHGAGAGMRHPFLEAIAQALLTRDVATLRYEFPYMEAKKSRPDSPAVAAARVRDAVERANRDWPGLPLLAGGKSFGGRMTSTAQAESPLPGVKGLVFLGFPLHPPGKPGTTRAEHLFQIPIPMLFLQGTRDEFAQRPLITEVCDQLGPRATLQWIEGGDHSFKVSKGRDVIAELVDHLVHWAGSVTP